MKKNILLTGSESFVASFLVKKLKKKYNIIGIDAVKKSKNTKFEIDITKDFIKKFFLTIPNLEKKMLPLDS